MRDKIKSIIFLTMSLFMIILPIGVQAKENKQEGYPPSSRAWYMDENYKYMKGQDIVRKGILNPKDLTDDYWKKEYTTPDEKGDVIFGSEPFETKKNEVKPIEPAVPDTEKAKKLELENNALEGLEENKSNKKVDKKVEISQQKVKDNGIPTFVAVIIGLVLVVGIIVIYNYYRNKNIKTEKEKENVHEEDLNETLQDINKENDKDFDFNDYLNKD